VALLAEHVYHQLGTGAGMAIEVCGIAPESNSQDQKIGHDHAGHTEGRHEGQGQQRKGYAHGDDHPDLERRGEGAPRCEALIDAATRLADRRFGEQECQSAHRAHQPEGKGKRE